MRKLYLQIYLAFVGIIVLFGVLAAIAWFLLPQDEEHQRVFEGAAALLSEMLPRPDRPVAELQSALDRLAEQFGADLAVADANGTLLAAAGEPLTAVDVKRTQSGWVRGGRKGPTFALRLPDGRWLTVRHHHRRVYLLWTLGLLGIAIAIGAYPVVRRITRRLERLQARVDELGAGDLTARVEVEGSDEVADLAQSFNRAATRIERLVNAKQMMLASASHELRTPLTRIRMAIELLAAEERPELRDSVARDIAEFDQLIDELLLASRLEAIDELEHSDDVDLLAVLAEEGARVDANVGGVPLNVKGDGRMLRRLVRNLFENARRHGRGTPIDATLERLNESAVKLVVADRGPGVHEAERERIFEPFYRPADVRELSDGGIGLGLALVRQIARHHGGEVRCVPRKGGGTCFEVELRTGRPAGS
ncbi:MAG: ATP-binding protein [Acidiferrobacterales bacterium]